MKNILLIIIIFLATSCDKWTPINGEIINQSNDTIVIKLNLTSGTEITNLIPNGTFNGIQSTYTSKKNPKRNFNCCPCEFEFMQIYPKNTNRKLLKDYSSKDNWTLDKSQLKSDNQMKCTFIISASDIN